MDVLELIKKNSKIKEQIIAVLCRRFIEYGEMGIFEKNARNDKASASKERPHNSTHRGGGRGRLR
ncbi:hypothetical protein [Vulcanisaeta sp. JCM 14467]|uniref:hypothetical protein n=1 Tax=Vulcanisaeta sp. JCM 14467 TaxID=1295370 RepID=UPI0006D21A84|nr:hypothetical protein [Vulcanisaeta sp. JCM 14467]